MIGSTAAKTSMPADSRVMNEALRPGIVARRLRWPLAIYIAVFGSFYMWSSCRREIMLLGLMPGDAPADPFGPLPPLYGFLGPLESAGRYLLYVGLVAPWIVFYVYARRIVVRHLTVGHHCWKCDYWLHPPPGATRCSECGFEIDVSRARWKHYCAGRIWTFCRPLPAPREDDD
jgi:hypothetical protein